MHSEGISALLLILGPVVVLVARVGDLIVAGAVVVLATRGGDLIVAEARLGRRYHTRCPPYWPRVPAPPL